MDCEGEAHGDNFEVNLPDMDDSASDKSRKTPTSSLEIASISTDINSSIETLESNVIKDANKETKFDNNFVCKAMESEQMLEPVERFMAVDALEATTSQENSSSSSHADESNILQTDHAKAKRSINISKGQVHINSNASMEKSDDSSDEDSSKRQKLNKSVDDIDAENMSDDTVTFQKTKSKVKQRNYRKRRNITSDNEDSSGNTLSNEATREPSILDTDEGNVASASTRNESTHNEELNKSTRTHRARSETHNDESDQYKNERDDSNEWRTDNEDELNEEKQYEEEIPNCLKIEKPPPNWHIVPEVLNRQIGSNPLFQRRFYGSLHAVERLELMYNLDEHQGCVNALNFNEKGNLLASASDDLAVVIWDWALGKKRHWFMSGHTRNMFQAKWLPLDMEYLMVTCARDGQVRLLDFEHNTSERLAAHRGPSHKLAVHPETPNLVFSAGEDARVFSIDIRESKPSRLSSSYVDANRYQGHRNSATVKGVNFFGPKSEYIISGSDCGNIFIWDKNTGAIVQWMTGDKQGVVNCLEGHPHIPVLATSGLDYDVKIWVPSCKEPPMMKSLTNCIKSNMKNRKQENAPDATLNGQLCWILLRHIRQRDRIHVSDIYIYISIFVIYSY
ncbi:WD repeat-containing protein 42A [Camponotus floridanus]|uniref:WD repeat-containing protein 42A n=1 Tax=Camponotus floridanus TaxID=104421 RepID=E2AUW5_CAMFO|nr:WD repeat-containing protein 42A [Camponotus floridanus]